MTLVFCLYLVFFRVFQSRLELRELLRVGRSNESQAKEKKEVSRHRCSKRYQNSWAGIC